MARPPMTGTDGITAPQQRRHGRVGSENGEPGEAQHRAHYLPLIVEAAGGKFTDLQGGALTLDTTTVLASNGKLHSAVLSALA